MLLEVRQTLKRAVRWRAMTPAFPDSLRDWFLPVRCGEALSMAPNLQAQSLLGCPFFFFSKHSECVPCGDWLLKYWRHLCVCVGTHLCYA